MDTVDKSAPGVKPTMGANQVMIAGRISSVGTFDSKGKRMHQTVVALPAADEFSMPGAALLISSYRLGDAGSPVKALCSVTGVPRTWTGKQGEVNNTADMRCIVVE